MRRGTNWSVLWKTVTRIETTKIIPWIALRNTLGVTLPLATGAWLGQLYGGLVMSTGALNVSFSDGKDPYQQRARRMLLASFFCGIAVFVGSTTGRATLEATAVAAVWAFIAGMMVSLGTTPGDIATISLVVLVVFAAQPMTPQRAALAGLLALAGGVFQTCLSVISWLHHRYEPERRALGQLYSGLTRMIESHVDASAAPPVTSQTNEAGQALATLTSDYSLEGERYRSLLTQAERIRLSILAIKRLRSRMRRESIAHSPEVLDRVLDCTTRVCAEIGRLLLRETTAIQSDAELETLAALEKSIPDGEGTMDSGMARDARYQVAALAGQLRSAVLLASHSTVEGQQAFERQESKKPWTLRLTSSFAILRANLSLKSSAFRHATRLACCIAAGVAIGRGVGLVRPYWIPMTIAIVLKPDFSSTFSRGFLRFAGTYVGLLVATGLFHVLTPSAPFEIALLAAFTFLCRCFGPANYGILTTAVSGLVVLLIAVTGVSPKEVIAARALNTTLGGLLALATYLAWPTWERTQISESMANLLEAYRKYFEQLTRAHLGTGGEALELERRRMEARVARTNMEASVERYRAEPGASTQELERIMAMLAASHRFAHAAMSLEAELGANPSRAIPPGFAHFASDVDRMFELLADKLKGKRHSAKEFPDLRASHSALLRDGGAAFPLLSTETDRIANSLNTLREKIQ